MRRRATYLVPFLIVLLLLLLFASLRPPWRLKSRLPQVCMFGSSETVGNAVRAAAQFPQVPSWFVVWGEDTQEAEMFNVHVIPGNGTTHASAWAMAFDKISSSRYKCDFYFATDDDLVWSVTASGRMHHGTKSVQKCLLRFLAEWQPAVVVFRWPWGEGVFPPLQELTKNAATSLVQPATGFDNGAMIFHSTVVRFFIPVWLGVDFEPGFTIQHTFQNFFVPFLFQSHAIRYNGIEYVNPPLSRHQYADSLNAALYQEHVAVNSKCDHQAWGAQLQLEMVTWLPERHIGPYVIDVSSIALFYNISDTVVSQHPFFRNLKWSQSMFDAEEHAVNLALASNTTNKRHPCSVNTNRMH